MSRREIGQESDAGARAGRGTIGDATGPPNELPEADGRATRKFVERKGLRSHADGDTHPRRTPHDPSLRRAAPLLVRHTTRSYACVDRALRARQRTDPTKEGPAQRARATASNDIPTGGPKRRSRRNHGTSQSLMRACTPGTLERFRTRAFRNQPGTPSMLK
jgi:hypothetical protein